MKTQIITWLYFFLHLLIILWVDVFFPLLWKFVMRYTLKTTITALSFITFGAVSSVAYSQTSQIIVNSGFGDPLLDFTNTFEYKLHGKFETHVSGPASKLYEYLGTMNYVSWTPIYDYETNIPYGSAASLHRGSSVQCVEAIQLLSNVGVTSRWRAKEQVSSVMSTPTPFVAATFTQRGANPSVKANWRYGSNTGSHVGIVFRIEQNGVWIFDQNWAGGNTGNLTIRFMTYSGNGQNNASNYYVVHQIPWWVLKILFGFPFFGEGFLLLKNLLHIPQKKVI